MTLTPTLVRPKGENLYAESIKLSIQGTKISSVNNKIRVLNLGRPPYTMNQSFCFVGVSFGVFF